MRSTAQQDERNEQADVVRFMMCPTTHGGCVPRHVETHLSHLFLVSDRVWKLKKAIRWSVVDYGTVERREHFCRREVAVNAPHAGDLYRGVRKIVRRGDGFAIDGDGPAVDWLVEMRRFNDGAQLDIMADKHTLTPTLVDATADAVAALHRRAPLRRMAGRRTVEVQRIEQLATDLASNIDDRALRATIETWRQQAQDAVDRTGVLIERRGRHGFVRRCHGDLHLSNICIWEGRPLPFDAVEFSEDLATIDVLYDLAFALADLHLRGATGEATRLRSRYLEWTRDYSGLAVLPLYESMRAMVRALVGTARGRDPKPPVEAALAALAPRPGPTLTAVGGLSGSGKTTVARAISVLTGAVVIRSDSVRKHLHKVPPEAPLPSSAYTEDRSASTYRRMRMDARRALRAGASVILDATFLSSHERTAAAELASSQRAAFHGVWLKTPDDVMAERLKRRTFDASDADTTVLAAQLSQRPVLVDWPTFDGTMSPERTAAAVAGNLR